MGGEGIETKAAGAPADPLSKQDNSFEVKH